MRVSSEYKDLESYKKSVVKCPCFSWARADYPSGFLSSHHAGCEKFDAEKEVRIMSQTMQEWINKFINSEKKIDQLQAELAKKDELIKEANEVIGFYGDDDNWYIRNNTYTIGKVGRIITNDPRFQDEIFEPDKGKCARAYLEKHKKENDNG